MTTFLAEAAGMLTGVDIRVVAAELGAGAEVDADGAGALLLLSRGEDAQPASTSANDSASADDSFCMMEF